jgi:ribonuclease VapC
MIVDTSAVLAIVFREDGHERLVDALVRANGAAMSAPNAAEVGMVLSARLGPKADGILDKVATEFRIEVVPFTAAHASTATEAFRRFGKGRHAAGLNFDDCMAYATAKLAQAPLLYVGADFGQTDIESAN